MTALRLTLTADGCAALAHARAFPAVTDLRLPACGFDDAAAVALAASPWPSRLRHLDLMCTRATVAGLLPLAQALRDGPLRCLDVRGCPLAIADMRLLQGVLGDRVRVP